MWCSGILVVSEGGYQHIKLSAEQWPDLQHFLENGDVENIILPSAVEKRNRLFFGPELVGEHNAVICILFQNYPMHSIEADAFLKDILKHLPA